MIADVQLLGEAIHLFVHVPKVQLLDGVWLAIKLPDSPPDHSKGT